ncbi:hypothetical protein [Actinomadura rudentiformis]|uniref:Uncharacterized protein n=1 Tax=Actinomadura rudentiformis TaxID=359158 RepID=A0A6H9YPI0_9ACTN|nr:hypothetical protein [Actinomadura rudentiformis]KAB2341013.1 hypothetical protein F8566_42700 [Actinomadura rudentiformis]
MDLSSAARELYGVAPPEFVATRKDLAQQAKEAGDAGLAKEIGALRRPTVSAWAVNLLSRQAAEELGQLLDVGADMRAAWASGGHIGELEQRRSELIAQLVRTAGRLASEAGHPLRDPAVREVEDTLQAATVDEDVAEEVQEGRLAQPRSHSGFGTAGFGFPAVPSPKRTDRTADTERAKSAKTAKAAKSPKPEPEQAREADELARRRAEKARRLAREAEKALSQRKDELNRAKRELNEITDAVTGLRRELEAAVSRQEAAQRKLDKAERAHERAAGAAEEARREAAAAQI